MMRRRENKKVGEENILWGERARKYSKRVDKVENNGVRETLLWGGA
jgi:hypothetical protein